MIEMGLADVYRSAEEALQAGDMVKAERLVMPAMDQFPDDAQLLFYASHILVKQERYALARLVVQRSIELMPTAPAYGNLGAVCRRMNDAGAAEAALRRSIEYNPKDANAWNNMAANFVNEGNPDPGIDAAKRAIELKPDFLKAKWNLGLLQLEKGEFREGWANYRVGMAQERQLRSYTRGEGGEPALLESLDDLLNFRAAAGKKPRIIVWGEQGIGDEIMFSTMLHDLDQYAEIVFECHPRLIGMFKRSYPFVREFHPTRKQDFIEWSDGMEPVQFKCAIGDLGLFFRPDLTAFRQAARKWQPFLKPDPNLVRQYRQTLEDLAPGKRFVGVAWTGGVIRTMRWYRSCHLHELYNLGRAKDVVLVSLQYEDDTAAIDRYITQTGRPMLRFPAITQHFDYDHTLALVCALDEVVSVCQSVAHLAGAADKPLHVLVPDKPAWRYGLKSDEWYWYGDEPWLYRRTGTSWDDAIQRLEFALDISPLPDHEQELLPYPQEMAVPGMTMLEMGCKQYGKYKAWFEYMGWQHTSVDLNGLGGALRLDLQQPLHLGTFHVVTNYGTSEHVAQQAPCWENILGAVEEGGWLVSTTPYPGDWPAHGKWYPDEQWYMELCTLNGFEVHRLGVVCEAPRRMVALRAQKKYVLPFTMPRRPIFENKGEQIKVGEYA